MIEAVNSVLSNAPLIRGNTDQVDVSRSVTTAPQQVQSVAVAPQAPYISPYISIDINYDKAVLQIRDSETGDVLKQFPSESRLQQQQRAQSASVQEPRQASPEVQDVNVSDGSGDTAQLGVSEVGSAPAAQAQIASAALAAGAQAGVNSLSAGVSVFA